jgi:hypothetical protein
LQRHSADRGLVHDWVAVAGPLAEGARRLIRGERRLVGNRGWGRALLPRDWGREPRTRERLTQVAGDVGSAHRWRRRRRRVGDST